MNDAIVRVQDRFGRGPWKPGFSDKWVDAWRTSGLPPIYEEEPNWRTIAMRAHKAGKHVGCAVRVSRFFDWFSPIEAQRLLGFGYKIVDASACEILFETPTQIFIANRKPLKRLPEFHFPVVA